VADKGGKAVLCNNKQASQFVHLERQADEGTDEE
jgi:hypothetical protein